MGRETHQKGYFAKTTKRPDALRDNSARTSYQISEAPPADFRSRKSLMPLIGKKTT